MTLMTTALFILNYNMPERANNIYETLYFKTVKTDIFLVDNGSDIMPMARKTNIILDKNVQTTNGWMDAINKADPSGLYKYYGFIITSMEFLPNTTDPVSPITKFLDSNKDAVGVHVSLSKDSTTNWEHLKQRPGTGIFRQTWMLDNIFSIYRTNWFREIGMFDRELIYAWGIDLETSWKARRDNKKLYVYQGEEIKKVTDIGYTMNRMNMKAEERSNNARENMNKVLRKKYGETYMRKMLNEFVTEDMR